MSYTAVPYTAVGDPHHTQASDGFESKWIDASAGPGQFPAQQRPVKKSVGHLKSTLDLLKALLLPIIAIAYLGFCYAVHYRTVPVDVHGIVNTSPSNIASIKAGVTSISIIIVAIGLWPLKDLVTDLKSEEFFRVLDSHNAGVPLRVVNGISNPSFGMGAGFKAMIQRHCSPFLAAAILAGFFTIATTTLAPAALTVQTVLSDSDVQAFAVGACGPQSVFNTSDVVALTNETIYNYGAKAASVAWAESSLGVTYGFGANRISKNKTYIVPTPVDLSTTTSARWISDVALISPSCSWAQTNITQPLSVNTTGTQQAIGVGIPGTDIVLRISAGDFTINTIEYAMPSIDISQSPSTSIGNQTSGSLPTDGTSVWVLNQCVGSGCPSSSASPTIYSDLTGIPYFQANSANGTFQVAVLMCTPNYVIETREIRSDGQGALTVVEDGRTLQKQGNLNPTQTGLLLNAALNQYQGSSGPQFQVLDSSTLGQMELLFGQDQTSRINMSYGAQTTCKPLPGSNITETYTTILQAAAKVYLSGPIGTAYVPGRVATQMLVFGSSLPHVIVSTFLFACLSLLVIIAHFRRGKDHKFTLFGVATALQGSEIPARFSQTRWEQGGATEEEVMKSLGTRLISMSRNTDGSAVLHVI